MEMNLRSDTKKPLCLSTIFWKSKEGSARECSNLSQLENGYCLRGTVLTLLENAPYMIQYTVTCDGDWHTKTVEVIQTSHSAVRTLRLEVDDAQRWWRDGEEIAELRGCFDIDLGVTPATNTLPIRRLELREGESAGLTAAWLRFPGLELGRLDQSYTRLAENKYRYESRGGAYRTALEVDKYGFVISYGDLWRRLE